MPLAACLMPAHFVRHRVGAVLRRVAASGRRAVALGVTSPAPEHAPALGLFRRTAQVDGVTVVATPEAAARALEVLHRHRERPHAWDTETADLVVGRSARAQSPVNHGRVVCATCYCGDDVDFGSGPRLFIDNTGPAAGLLLHFRDYFESDTFQKVFHNYSFERHLLQRHGIALRGFHADTLHLARLHDTSRSSWEGSVQAKLQAARSQERDAEGGSGGGSSSLVGAGQAQKALGFSLGGKPLSALPSGNASKLHTMSRQSKMPTGYSLKSLASQFGLVDQQQLQFKELFGVHAEAAQEAHDCPESFLHFAEYSTQDAVLTYRLFEAQREELRLRPWHSPVHAPLRRDRAAEGASKKKRGHNRKTELEANGTGGSMWNMYELYIRDLGECLADVEAAGIGVDCERLEEIESCMLQDVEHRKHEVMELLGSVPGLDGAQLNPDLELINYQSPMQLQVLLFGGAEGRKPDRTVPTTKEFKAGKRAFQLKSLGLVPSNKLSESSPVTGLPKVSVDVLKQLSGNPSKGVEGVAKQQLLEQGYPSELADEICSGLKSMSEVNHTKRMLTNVIKPLQEFSKATSRIHASWKFDTATGRIACRSPNLQNLPSVEQDKHGIRDAFQPKPGHTFVIADYGQLELCILAHLAECPTMISKLNRGGDYHSETAAEMFPHVQEAIERGDVALSGASARELGIPSVKERFVVERSQAKAINFGIIYGKTPVSLAEDLGISKEEAEALMERWYSSKPGVLDWIKRQKKEGWENQRVISLLGRWRNMPLLDRNLEREFVKYAYRSERAAVNYGVQGSAADVVMAAMLRLWSDEILKILDFRIVLQVHDEFVLEGPEDAAEEAKARVVELMEQPFAKYSPRFHMRVPLKVDARVRPSFG